MNERKGRADGPGENRGRNGQWARNPDSQRMVTVKTER